MSMKSLLLLGLGLLAGCQTSAVPHQRAVALAITNVTVIDPETRSVLRSRSVYVDGGRIVAVLPARRDRGYAPAAVVDGSGKFLIPGLIDMHAHLFLPGPTAPTLNLMLANGVTGFRQMAGDCWEALGARVGCIGAFRDVQRAIRAGEIAGPDIVSIASGMVMGPAVLRPPTDDNAFLVPSTVEEARRLAQHLRRRGVDFIKTQEGIPATVLAALGAEARSLGLHLSGHVPAGVPVTELARHNFLSIEHARDLLYDCSRYGAEFRRLSGAFTDRQPGATRPDADTRMARTINEFDPALCRDVLTTLARNGTYYVPTHVTREMDARARDGAYRADPNRRYISAARNAEWDRDLNETAASSPTRTSLYDGFFRHGLRVTGLAHRAGVRIMAGSDANDTMIFPGFSLHRELWLLTQAGLTPMDALRAATTVPAAYLEETDRLGGVAAGKEADLVLLNANPLSDIRNTTSVAAVIADGRFYDRGSLDRLLADAETAARED
jgi:hypothetical protein